MTEEVDEITPTAEALAHSETTLTDTSQERSPSRHRRPDPGPLAGKARGQ